MLKFRAQAVESFTALCEVLFDFFQSAALLQFIKDEAPNVVNDWGIRAKVPARSFISNINSSAIYRKEYSFTLRSERMLTVCHL